MTQPHPINAHDQSLSTLMRIMEAATGALDLSALAQSVLERALAVTGGTSGSIWLRDQGEVVCVACYPGGLRPPDPEAALIRVVATGQPEFAYTSGDPHEPSEPRPIAILPLIAREELIGALLFAGAPGEPAGVPEPVLLEALATYIASALQQARFVEQIECQRRRIATIERQQEELISIISHDLKNPMASIKGYADLLLRRSARNPNDPNRRGLEVISEQIVRMTDLLDQLRDIARISTDRLKLDRRQTDLAVLTARVVEKARETTDRRQLNLEGADAPLIGAFDVTRISQALGNLVSNAIAYSPGDGAVNVRLERGGNGSKQEALISISDRGIGIPPADRQRVFEPFFRASNAASQAGMGMGLFVAQQLVARHGGRIWFESAVGDGTTFYVALPLEQTR